MWAPASSTSPRAIQARWRWTVGTGLVDYVDSTRIVVRVKYETGEINEDMGADIYPMTKLGRSNQNTCINQKPISGSARQGAQARPGLLEEMLEMASAGAKVLQTRSVELAMVYKVPLQVRSSFEPPDAANQKRRMAQGLEQSYAMRTNRGTACRKRDRLYKG